MESTFEKQVNDTTPQSLKSAWQHCRKIWAASSFSDAWQSFKNTIEALPIWAVVVVGVGVVVLLANSSLLIPPLVAAGFLAALYYTVKLAVLAALKQHDSSSNQSSSNDQQML